LKQYLRTLKNGFETADQSGEDGIDGDLSHDARVFDAHSCCGASGGPWRGAPSQDFTGSRPRA
jgi:hypothetical protein